MRADVLIGPASAEWLAALFAALRFGWRVERSETRAGFQRDLGVTGARVVVLCELDGDGAPNTPLLAHCTRRRLIERVILVHESAAVRLPSPWSAPGLVIEHVMAGNRTVRAASAEVAALLRTERPLAGDLADPETRPTAFPVV